MVHAHPKGRMKMGKQIFRIQLDDHAMPGFASGHKDYFGTLDMIEGFINAIRNDEQFAERYQNLVSFFDRYKAGETDIEHSVAYGVPRPLLVRTRCIAERRSVLTNHKWEHLNIWQWPYDMKCKVADCQHVWLTCHKRFMRCIKVEFTNLKYQHLHGEWDHPGFIWGYPHMIEVEVESEMEQHKKIENKMRSTFVEATGITGENSAIPVLIDAPQYRKVEEFARPYGANVDQILKWFFDAIVSIVGSGYCSCLRKAPKNYS